MEGIRETLHAYRVEFDTYFLEGSLHEGDPSPIAIAFERLREQGHLYESEGALWLRTTEFGDDKDRVLERSTGAPTYFAADVAYQEDKFRRGFDRAIYVLGADHHGYIARLKAIAMRARRGPDRRRDPDPAVRAHRRGRRAGEDVQAPRRLRDARRADRARSAWTPRAGSCSRARTTRRSTSTSSSRPSRTPRTRSTTCSTCTRGSPSILRNSEPRAASTRRSAPSRAAWRSTTSERELVRRLLAFPNEVREAVERRAPHRIASYALELGQAFAAFYRDSPVLKEPDEALRAFRIALCVATQRTLAAALGAARRLRPGVHVDARPITSSRRRGCPEPYVHADNRGLVLCNGPQCVSSRRSQLRSCAETFEIIADEGRATRSQGPARRRRLHDRRRRRPLRRHAGPSALGDASTSPTSRSLREAIAPR